MLILLVCILSFGVIYQANLYPNAPQQWSILQDVLYYPYWQLYGELFLEYIEGALIILIILSIHFNCSKKVEVAFTKGTYVHTGFLLPLQSTLECK